MSHQCTGTDPYDVECVNGNLHAYCSACAHDGGCGCVSYPVGRCVCECHTNGMAEVYALRETNERLEQEERDAWIERQLASEVSA